MEVCFQHRHAAHCESGAISALLRHQGLNLSEPLAFGIGGGLFFLHVPFIKMGGIPLTSYRDAPGKIIKRLCHRLGIRMRTERYRDPDQGMRALDELLKRGVPVGLQTSVFWLPYFPPDMRFQFNAHNLVAYGKRGNDYLLSDPVAEAPVSCPAADLRRARFAKGLFAPRGLIYYPESVPADPDLKRVVRGAIRATAKRMLEIPLPFMGVRGIRHMAKRLEHWPDKYGAERAQVWVGSVVRMQEEIGTGGAGFRFLYAAFLQEAAAITNQPALDRLASLLTSAGDRWREFAVRGARLCKAQGTNKESYGELANILRDCANREDNIFRELRETT